ncbi:hypothetical protein PHLCEN_2v4148 [Hermanssonia centrifuga]|uniref:Dihydrolipoamide acetyltransferase component of pyruvate dehydrogenase complex n=1 Tax=Hermanssonia centrifuga TaxID=98765 RepID=A0A2R6PZ57_9APHY|nr:hypothetical protein PHLCEN_2v4148 [Hermanssonia centrifuga]
MLVGRFVRLPKGRPALLAKQVSLFHLSHSCWGKVLRTFKLADIGEGITECEVIRWCVWLISQPNCPILNRTYMVMRFRSVQPPNTIQAFDALCEVQSDKASVEITSPFDGIVKELLVKEGDVAKVGEGLCVIEVDEEAPAADAEPASPPPHPEQETAQISPSEVEKPEVNSVSVTQPQRRPHPLDPNVPQDAKAALGTNAENVLATPSVRHFARQNGVDLAVLAPGSGKGGRVEKKDVEAYLAAPSQTKETAAGGQGEDVVVELGRTRYGMWKAMVKSLEIPHFGYSTSLDLTTLHDLMPILNSHIPSRYFPPSSSPPPPPAVSPSAFYAQPTPPPVGEYASFTRLTYLPLLLKTLSKAMIEWPLFRSSITPSSSPPSSEKPTLTLRPHADINIALSTPTGLYTPTIQSVDTHSVYSLASRLKHLSHLGRQVPCGLTTTDMPKRGGTLTVSNIGGIGDGEGASPILVPGGGVAIVAVGRAKWVWDVNRGDGKGERRLKVNVSWSADHRVVEGAELVAFIEAWRSWVESPQRLIGEGV